VPRRTPRSRGAHLETLEKVKAGMKAEINNQCPEPSEAGERTIKTSEKVMLRNVEDECGGGHRE